MIEIFVAVIGALALIMGGLLTYVAAKRSSDMQRVAALEERVHRIGLANQKLWRHNRELTDHIYRGLGPPPPPFPEGLFDE